MRTHISTTPFGRRSLSLAHVVTQATAKARAPDKTVHKWNLFRSVCTAKTRLGVSDRALAVLDALLSFHPETVLSGEDLIVFPSNQQLSLRAHGMAPATLRRHLAQLVDAGLIVRRDSPNGKRYARKGRDGELELAFGFDLSALVARADQIEAWAEEVRAEERALKLVRERITLCRRDIAKMIATGIQEGVPTRALSGSRGGDWMAIHGVFRAIVDGIQRNASIGALEPIADELSALAEDILSLLESHVKTQNLSTTESHSERHKQNSNPDSPIESEPRLSEGEGAIVQTERPASRQPDGAYPLGMVLDACPDMTDYASGGIGNWRDFMATVAVVRPMLGISPSAWEEAKGAMGEVQAGVVVAAILQRGTAIGSPGGYMRELTRKAETGAFSIGPMLMALLGKRKMEKRRA